MQYTAEQLQKLYKQLPPKVKDAVFSDETANVMQEMGTKHHLHVDQVGKIADETGMVLLGVAPRSKFPEAIAGAIGVSKEIAEQIAGEVGVRVFDPIKEDLKRATSGAVDAETLPSPEEENARKLRESLVPKPSAPLAPPVFAGTPPKPRLATLPTYSPEPAAPITAPGAQSTPPPPLASETRKDETPPPVTASAPVAPAPAPVSGIIGAKLGGVTYGGGEKQTAPATPSAPAAVDLYREPIT